MVERVVLFTCAVALALSWSEAAAATVDRNQACVASVANLRDLPQDQVSIEGDSGGGGGLVEMFFRTATIRGSCLFDARDRLIDVRIAGGTLPWNGRGGGDVSAQEQACAGEMARRFNVPITSVGISDVSPARRGGRQMMVSSPDARVRCVTTQFNAITEFTIFRQ